ncbi:MAG: hypothetical protein HYR84_02350 [Planctomycetes bacterium]|nr:hypothetical protein [Planctomycetota bacterium]
MKSIGPGAMLATLAVFCVAGGQTPDNKLEMTPVKYAGLKEEILKHRGNVLILDIWAGW